MNQPNNYKVLLTMAENSIHEVKVTTIWLSKCNINLVKLNTNGIALILAKFEWEESEGTGLMICPCLCCFYGHRAQ